MGNAKQSLPLDEQSIKILTTLLEGEKKISELLPLTNNSYHTLRNKVQKLKDAGFIEISERRQYGDKGPKIIILRITEKGQAVAEKLMEAEEAANMTPEELEEQRKRIHWIIDINTLVDHITAYDIHDGKKEIFNIWLKPNGKYLRLYCDKCDSYDCYHVNWALHDPVIGPEIREKAEKKGLKIKEGKE